MKKLHLLPSLVGALLIGAASAQAQTVIIDNDFDSVTLDTYDGTTGEAFGTDAALGNATGNRTTAVTSDTGIGNPASQGMTQGNNNPPAMRSRNSHDTTLTTSFSTYFEKGSDNSGTNNIAVLGWATSGGTDDVSAFSGGLDDRFLVGVLPTASTAQTYNFSSASAIRNSASSVLSGSPTFTLTTGNWYELSFDLTFDSVDDNWNIADLTLRDWGTDGITGGSTLASMASVSDVSRNSISDGFAFTAGQNDAGFTAMDNVNVTAIPEPSAAALLLGVVGATFLFARRHRRAD